MANEYDYEVGGSGFMMGLLTGTVLGAGLGMLFAPKSGSELRGHLSESYHKAADKATDLAEKGRDMGRDVMGRAKDAVSRGAEEAKRYSSEAQPGSSTSPGSSGSSYGTGSTPGSPYSSGPTRDRG